MIRKDLPQVPPIQGDARLKGDRSLSNGSPAGQAVDV
jgi:hypothetical protein